MKSDTLPKNSKHTVRRGFAVFRVADFTGALTRVSPVCFTKRTLRKLVARETANYNTTKPYQVVTLSVLYDVECSHVIRTGAYA